MRSKWFVWAAGVSLVALAVNGCFFFGPGQMTSQGGGAVIRNDGGNPVPTPDPLNADLPQWGVFTGPVPAHIQEATGATTWPEVVAWMEQQMEEGGAGANFVGDVTAVITEDGEVHSVEIVEREHPDDPPAAPGPGPDGGGQ